MEFDRCSILNMFYQGWMLHRTCVCTEKKWLLSTASRKLTLANAIWEVVFFVQLCVLWHLSKWIELKWNSEMVDFSSMNSSLFLKAMWLNFALLKCNSSLQRRICIYFTHSRNFVKCFLSKMKHQEIGNTHIACVWVFICLFVYWKPVCLKRPHSPSLAVESFN